MRVAGSLRGGETLPQTGKWVWRVIAVLVLIAVGFLIGAAWRGHQVSLQAKAPVAENQANQGEEAFSVRFVESYLTYDSTNRSAYVAEIAPYLASNVDPNQLWDGEGDQTVTTAVATGQRSAGDGVDVVTVAALVGHDWLYVAVPIHQGNGFTVVATPALVPGPGHASYQAPTAPPESPTLTTQLQGNIQAFFVAYAASDWSQLSYYTPVGSSVGGLGGAVTLKSFNQLTVYQGGNTRKALADVTWSDHGADLEEQYMLTLVKQGGKWLVESISAVGGQ